MYHKLGDENIDYRMQLVFLNLCQSFPPNFINAEHS